jgi:hypothetical protein
MLQPARHMTAARIAMRPMNDTPLGVPLIFAAERDGIPYSEGKDSGSEIYVVGDKKSLTGTEFQDKALMARPVVIVRQNPDDDAVSFNLIAAIAFVECAE